MADKKESENGSDDNTIRYHISCGTSHSLIASDDGLVWSCGNGKSGVLGTLGASDVLTPILVRDGVENDGLESLHGKRVVHVAAGAQHNAVVTNSGEVYTWGNDKHGRLGHGPPSLHNPRPDGVLREKNLPMRLYDVSPTSFIKQVSCGFDFTICLDDEGHLFSFGMGSSGCLGHGSTVSMDRPTIIRSLISENIKEVSCGAKHVVLLFARALLSCILVFLGKLPF